MTAGSRLFLDGAVDVLLLVPLGEAAGNDDSIFE